MDEGRAAVLACQPGSAAMDRADRGWRERELGSRPSSRSSQMAMPRYGFLGGKPSEGARLCRGRLIRRDPSPFACRRPFPHMFDLALQWLNQGFRSFGLPQRGQTPQCKAVKRGVGGCCQPWADRRRRANCRSPREAIWPWALGCCAAKRVWGERRGRPNA